jgi:hypothetical protein
MRVVDIAWRYVGKGEFLAGVPARSLTAEEAAGREAEIEGSGLYERVRPLLRLVVREVDRGPGKPGE